MPSLLLDETALTGRLQTRLTRLRGLTADRLAAIFAALGVYTTTDRWLRLAGPVMTAGQNQAISTQAAYLRRLVGDFDLDRAAALERAAIAADDPFVAFATALDRGDSIPQAIDSGAARAHQLGQSAVTWAARAANASIDDRVDGWARVLNGPACPWCVSAAADTYRTADSASFGHRSCHCGVTPVIGDRNPGHALNISAG